MAGNDIKKLSALIRYHILTMTTRAGSGHPTSSLSAVDLMTVLWFGAFFRFDLKHPEYLGNDRLIFSKGHASPLYYALYVAAGEISEKEIEGYRTFESVLEGHPTPRFRYTEAATGSLGQGLSVGVGMAMTIKKQHVKSKEQKEEEKQMTHNSRLMTHDHTPRVYVLLGDGEMAEGSVWEAAEIAGQYGLDNLIAVVDVNRLGQSGETMLGWDTDTYRDRFLSFGWETTVIDGHDVDQIANAYEEAKLQSGRGKPFAIIAKTKKGKGVSLLENKDNWHGKPLPQHLLDEALKEMGDVDLKVRGELDTPSVRLELPPEKGKEQEMMKSYAIGDLVATRKAYGQAITRLGYMYPRVVCLDAEVKNSSHAEDFKAAHPDRFFEMYIAEQNMVGTALGMARRGYVPFASTFAAFLSRGFDQMRMAALSQGNIKFVGSHAGISIGEDGPSQMGLEDISMFRSIHGANILYPSDAVSTERLVEQMIQTEGMIYLRTSRPTTPVIYGPEEEFPIGGMKVHFSRIRNEESGIKEGGKKILIVSAGVNLHEALKAQDLLEKDEIEAIVVDLYSIKPVDARGLWELVAKEKIQHVLTVEDHWYDGGIGDVILNVFACPTELQRSGASLPPCIHKLAVKDMPRSGKPAELLAWAGIDAASIQKKVNELRMEL